ncbi:MAG TPA: hypothetical protein VK773_01540 [Acidimicrobiales bacterium]|jgi:hypothetical protein|nr:hypothetical protein [Acidimicrobiales bacterium]
MDRRFGYAVDRRFLPVLLPIGLRRSKDGVTITDDGSVNVTFGVLSLRTQLDNVTESHITRDYRWWTAIGPRMSFVDDGLTFGTNARAGVCMHFRERVPSLLRRQGHSALTVTVEELEGLVAALAGPADQPNTTAGS